MLLLIALAHHELHAEIKPKMIRPFNPFVIDFNGSESKVILRNINDKEDIIVYRSSNTEKTIAFYNHLNSVINDRYNQHRQHEIIRAKNNVVVSNEFRIRDTDTSLPIHCDDDRDTTPGTHE